MDLALNGSGLFGFIASRKSEGDHKPAVSTGARFTTWIHDRFGDHHSNLFPLAVMIALLAVPFWWRSPGRKPALFAIVFSLVTFAFMAVTRDPGEAVHHSLLVWPMPHLLVGVALASLSQRWPRLVLASVLVLSDLLAPNQYIFQFDRYGAHGNFADAFYPLADALPAADTEHADEHIYVMDWASRKR